MNYNISELNELAQSVSHCLKHLNPKTMFWHTRNAVAFTNHDCFKVQPYRELKKPFGKLAVLESFARSLGFNTYKGLMESGIDRFELSKKALLDLNPNPLNLLLTECWEEITRWLMEGLFKTEFLNPNKLGNFKQSKLSQYAVFTFYSSVSPFSWLDRTLYKNNKFKLDEIYEGILPMVGMADAIFHKGLEAYIESKGVKQWFDSPEIDEQAYLDFMKKYRGRKEQDVVVVKLADLLVRKQDADRDYMYILEEVGWALSMLYDTQLELKGGMKNGKFDYSEIELNFYFSPAQISEYMSARIAEHNHRNYQTACSRLIEKYKDDNTLYTCIEPLNAFEMGYTGQDWLNKIQATSLSGVDYGNLGKKVYWVNTAVHSFITYGSVVSMEEGVKWVKTIPVESYIIRIESFLDEQLKPVEIKQIQTPPRIARAKYEYKYNLIGRESFTDRFPECMMVMSDYPLKYHLGELFVQTVLLNSIGFDDEDKFIGKPDLLAVGIYWKVMIQQTKSVRKAQQCHRFDPIAMLRSLFIYVDDNEGGVSFKEDDETVSFNIGLKFIDVLYQYIHTDEYENVHESTSLILPLCIGVNKQTKTCSVLSCGEYNIEYYESIENMDYRTEICPITEKIAEYLMQFKEINELISKFCLRFYNGDKKKAYEEAIKYDGFNFEIRPIRLAGKGLSLDEIANSEPYAN